MHLIKQFSLALPEGGALYIDELTHNDGAAQGYLRIPGVSSVPDDAFFLTMHSGEIGKNNWSRYANKELDHLLHAGRTAWKWPDRLPHYKKVVEIIKESINIIKPISLNLFIPKIAVSIVLIIFFIAHCCS